MSAQLAEMQVAQLHNMTCDDIKSVDQVDFLSAEDPAEAANKLLLFCHATTKLHCNLWLLVIQPYIGDTVAQLWMLYASADCRFKVEYFALSVWALLVSIIGVPANSLVIHAVLHDRQLHSATNKLLLSLATSDLVFLLTSCYTTIMTVLITTAEDSMDVQWLEQLLKVQRNKYLCLILEFPGVAFACLMASLFSLMAIALDKYVAIYYPLKRAQLLNSCRVNLLIACIWTVSMTFGLMPVMGWNRFQGVCVFVDKTCYEYLLTWGITCTLCAITIVVLYVQIYRMAVKHSRRSRGATIRLVCANPGIAADTHGIANSVSEVSTSCVSLTEKKKRCMCRPPQALKTISLLLLGFYLGWLPLLVYLLVYPYRYTNLDLYILMTIALTCSMYNPFIYGLRNGKLSTCSRACKK